MHIIYSAGPFSNLLTGDMQMSLIKCPECSERLSSSAEQCPLCGCEITPEEKKAQKKRKVIIQCIVDITFIVIGTILLLLALPKLTRYNFDYLNGQYLFKDRDTLIAFITFSLGGGLMLGSVITLLSSIIKLRRE